MLMAQPTRKMDRTDEKTLVIDHETFGETEEEFRAEAGRRYKHMRETGLHVTQAEAEEWLQKLLRGENPPLPKPHL